MSSGQAPFGGLFSHLPRSPCPPLPTRLQRAREAGASAVLQLPFLCLLFNAAPEDEEWEGLLCAGDRLGGQAQE